MKPEELRIGNYVYRPDLGDGHTRTEKILAIGIKAMVSGPVKVRCEYSELEPIPLTEQWLLDFGGGKKDNAIFIDRFKFHYVEEYKFWYVLDAFTLTYITKIEFVHELQNVFFILNGKELTKKQ